MTMTWENIQNELHSKLEKLNKSEYSNIEDVNFQRGIYVFYEEDKPIYVGRSNRIGKRLKEHGNVNSSHFSASFAFLLAKQIAKENNIEFKREGKNKSRTEIQNDSEFDFKNQKQRVAKMKFKTIEIEDSNFQAIFEIYVSMQLNTFYNKFDNH